MARLLLVLLVLSSACRGREDTRPDLPPTGAKTAADYEPGRIEAIMERSSQAMDASDLAGAEKWAARALELAPGDPDVWLHWCIFAYDAARFAESERACTVAIRLWEPGPPEYHALLNRGLARIKLGQLDGAYEDFQRCKKQEPENAEAWYDESWVWAARGDRDAVIANLKKAGQYDHYYAMYEVVAEDEAFERFREDPTWRAFTETLDKSNFERRVPGLHKLRPIPGVPLSEEKGLGGP